MGDHLGRRERVNMLFLFSAGVVWVVAVGVVAVAHVGLMMDTWSVHDAITST